MEPAGQPKPTHAATAGAAKHVGGLSLNAPDVERDELEVDVLFVGAGSASLSAAIRLADLAKAAGRELTMLVLEKAEEIGHHTLSGAVMDPRAIRELFPDFLELGFPIEAPVERDWVEVLLPKGKHVSLKGPLVPPQFRNHGNYIVSLNRVVGWLKDQAEARGVDVYAGFAAAGVLWEGDRVVGVQTRDAGIDKHGNQKPGFQAGMNVRAKVTVFAEGTRGHLAKGVISRLGLDAGRNPQIYETGIKEIWQVRDEVAKELEGAVIHTAGLPLGLSGYGGGWIYGLGQGRISIGHVVGLDHRDPSMDPHALFVEWKQHPALADRLAGGQIVRYGAKTIPGGGYFSMPQLVGHGFVLVGDSAGFVNMSRLKGIHLAMKSGMLAADGILAALTADDTSAEGLMAYPRGFEASWAKEELWSVRNFRQGFAAGMVKGSIDAGLQMITGGRGLVARRSVSADHEHTATLAAYGKGPSKPKFDDKLFFDKLTDVYHSGAVHEEDQPSHLVITDPSICVTRCTEEYGNPCQHFCPAAVYEWPSDAEKKGVRINASNCVHCKTCDIADPYQIIEWTVPEGGGGPRYVDM